MCKEVTTIDRLIDSFLIALVGLSGLLKLAALPNTRDIKKGASPYTLASSYTPKKIQRS
jgi:hypothetical protein